MNCDASPPETVRNAISVRYAFCRLPAWCQDIPADAAPRPSGALRTRKHVENDEISIMTAIGRSSLRPPDNSRTLTALAEEGYRPSIFSYVDRAGHPLALTITIILFGALAYVNLSAGGVDVFDWLLALSGLAALFIWGSVRFFLALYCFILTLC